MEEDQEQGQAEAPRGSSWFHMNRSGAAAVIILLVLAGLALSYAHRQGATINHLASNQADLNATIGQIQSELNTIATKLNEMSAAQTAAASAANGRTAASAQPGARRVSAQPSDAGRLRQMQARLEQQQKQLKETQDDVAKTRSDLEGSLNSTRDELNGSIAKTHEELVALQNRGERNYYEFDLAKSKRFLRSGPIMLSLRKTDIKHQHLDLAMIVNDNELSKKNVNLYEPVWVYDTSDPMPVQVVVNQIGSDRVHGYVSVPKYRQVNLAGGVTPVSVLTPASNSNPTTTAPLQ
jgi:outer membrane murein-binding lipoprotein Lpp